MQVDHGAPLIYSFCKYAAQPVDGFHIWRSIRLLVRTLVGLPNDLRSSVADPARGEHGMSGARVTGYGVVLGTVHGHFDVRKPLSEFCGTSLDATIERTAPRFFIRAGSPEIHQVVLRWR